MISPNRLRDPALDISPTHIAPAPTAHTLSLEHPPSPVRDARPDPLQVPWQLHLATSPDEAPDEAFLHARRLEELGRVLAGVAHDVNNFLTVVLGETDLLLDDTAAIWERPPEGLQGIRDAALRARRLTRRLLSLSRRGDDEIATDADVSASVTEMADFLARLVGPDVRVRTVLDSGLPRVRLVPGHLDQILLNLGVNARDAMPDGGILSICVELDRGMEQTRGGGGRPAGVLLTVADTGTGMDGPTRRRIFEPFFTTKDKDRGTGLGLATVAEVVRRAGGRIEVESEPGRGTAFRLHLPAAPLSEGEGSDARSPSEREDLPATRGVLVVDDDPSVRSLVARFLSRQGYAVVQAGSGAEAEEVLREAGPLVGLVITDVKLPDTEGPALWKRLNRQVVGLRALFISGYQAADLADLDLSRPGVSFLSKPFDLDALDQEVARVLAEP